jgi:hypothetical protein
VASKASGRKVKPGASFKYYLSGQAGRHPEGLTGPQPDTEKTDRWHRRNYDMGLGTLISFSQSEHQDSHKVWGTQLDDYGHYQPIDLQ